MSRLKAKDPKTAERRLMGFLKEASNGCIEFTGNRLRSGYGQFTLFGKPTLAHRAAWLLLVGPIPEGMNVCHSCDNRICCNVNHLFIGTQSDNVRDCIAKGRFNVASVLKNKPYCVNGHKRTPENLYISPSGARSCRECARVHGLAKYYRNRAKELSRGNQTQS